MAVSARDDLASSRDDNYGHPNNLSEIFLQSDFYRRATQLLALEQYGVAGGLHPRGQVCSDGSSYSNARWYRRG